jgi:serine/threonine-protein kinase
VPRPIPDDRWRVLGPYLDRALDMADDERRAWLASLGAEDPTLAADLETLLEERDALSREGFLEDTAPAPPSPGALAGQTIGAYTLISLIGQGGMGSVWLARRSDGRFEAEAAVKLLNVGSIGRAGGERFEREGRILARLTHPHVARLLDAGVSPAGQPYLVLEHVEGEHIDRHCRERGLGVEARLRLFLDVLAAVGHAHANLIVHRDIKPSNVLVRNDGQVKLLDFGIAKLLEGEAVSGQATALTRDGGRAMTPEYAAPEQLTDGPITTATDVYALGVLLYVLLCGRHPAGTAVRSPAELLQAIVDAEAPRPSSVTEDAKLARVLRGDVDTIVAKALKKDPRERYASVTALAEDLRRYLEHEPITARPDTLAYRAGKFVRRHRAPVVLAGLALVALVGGLAGTVTQARRAARHAALAEAQRTRADEQARAAGEQRDFALRQLSRAEAINDLNSFLLSDAAPSGKPFTVGELLARAEAIVDRQQDDADENKVEMLISLGRQYQSQDQDDKSRPLLARAYELALKLPDRSVRAKAACAMGAALAPAGEFERAEKFIGEGLAELPDRPQFALHRVFCLLRGSYVAREAGDPQTGIERVQGAQRLLAESRLGSPLLNLRVSMDLAEAYRMAGRNREAAAAFEDAWQRLVALGRDETEMAGTLLNNWALAVEVLGQPLVAERLYRQAIRISSADGTERSVSPMLLNNLARVLRDLHRLAEATRYAERAHAEASRIGDEIVTNQSLQARAVLYRLQGDLGRAAEMLDLLAPRLRRTLPPDHIFFASLASQRSLLLEARGEYEAAKTAADRALALAEKNPQGLDSLPTFLLRRAPIALRLGRAQEAHADAVRALRMLQEAVEPGTLSSAIGRAYLTLGRALHAQGKIDEARAASATAEEHLQPSVGTDHPDTRQARQLATIAAARR